MAAPGNEECLFGVINGNSGRTVERPAAIFLMTTRPLCTGVVQQALPNMLPDSMLTIEPKGEEVREDVPGFSTRSGDLSIDLLDFDRTAAAPASDSQKMLGKFVQPQRGNGGSGWPDLGVARVLDKRLPVLGREVVVRSQDRRAGRSVTLD